MNGFDKCSSNVLTTGTDRISMVVNIYFTGSETYTPQQVWLLSVVLIIYKTLNRKGEQPLINIS
jgi:hypothetical protein